jgi:hypothetical protein
VENVWYVFLIKRFKQILVDASTKRLTAEAKVCTGEE